MKKQTKKEGDSLLRVPKAKNKFGLKIKPITMPHQDLIKPEVVQLEIVPPLKKGEQNPTQPNITQPNITQPNKVEISPTKNFTKVSNSIFKAVPEKYFRGLSKQTYEALYNKTRGAITPTRKVQLTKIELIKLTGLSLNSVQTHIRYLKESGLVKVEMIIGKHEGSIYEILTPEEIENRREPHPTLPNITPPNPTQKTLPDTTQKLDRVGWGNRVENKGTYGFPKTSLKTEEKNDDELARRISAKLRETHGRELTAKEKGKMDLIRDAVAEMLGTAFGKAETISDAVNFALEHLHRLNAQPRVMQNLPLRKKDEVGRHDFDREAELVIWRDVLADGGVVEDFEQYRESYAVEDWQWLMSEIAR